MDAASAKKEQQKFSSINAQIQTGYYAKLLQRIEKYGSQSLKKCIQSIVSRLGFTHFSFINADRTDFEQITLNTLPESIVRNTLPHNCK